jgi:hypothetical protein
MLSTTQEVPFISSIHGRKRRHEREITKEELQAAVKYGTKEATHTNGMLRWKYSFGDIVYIADETSSVEVTCYTVEKPLGRVVISERLAMQYDEANLRNSKRPKIITSHTVLIVDMSGSMRKSDMQGHKSRAKGVYFTIAEDFIASRLLPAELGRLGGGEVTNTDVVTLIEMRSTATVVFECEPISWQLYNRFIDLHDCSRPRDHGRYFESFQCAFEIIRKQTHDIRCAVCVFFFSDGAPSDPIGRKSLPSNKRFPQNLYQMITNECALYKQRLTFSAYGFGQNANDFSVMRQMIERGQVAGAKSLFGMSSIDPTALSLLLSSTVTSLTETRGLLSQLYVSSNQSARERVSAEKEKISKSVVVSLDAIDWIIFTPAVASDINRLALETSPREGSLKSSWNTIPFNSPSAVGFAVYKKYFGEGAERIVCKMTEINATGEPVGPLLVAKEPLYWHKNEGAEHLEHWHKNFIKTQCVASKLALRFNKKLDMLGVDQRIFRIKFLQCSIYNAHVGDKYHSYLVEKLLDPRRYLKYNNNAGGVSGVPQINNVDFEPFLPTLQRTTDRMAVINEDDVEDDGSDDNSESIAEAVPDRQLCLMPNALTQQLQSKVLDGDIPQAFSHWTYRASNQQLMVCDLQGQPSINGFFEFTDPSIHFHSERSKYGKTDHGSIGINNFFKTHQCNHLCRILGIANNSYIG